MKILPIAAIRTWDTFTIQAQNISSWDLMERAASEVFIHIQKLFPKLPNQVLIFCGIGNNGGDGLALARLLATTDSNILVLLPTSRIKMSADAQINLDKLKGTKVQVLTFNEATLESRNSDLVIDCLFGSGLNRPIHDGIYAEMIGYFNKLQGTKISVDLPSGMFTDTLNNPQDKITIADYTLTFQTPKRSFFFFENYLYTGEIIVVDIQLSRLYINNQISDQELVTLLYAKLLFRKRVRNSYKKTYGNLLLVAGSEKAGACILSSMAAVRSGLGLLTVMCDKQKHNVILTRVPEAMMIETSLYEEPQLINLIKYDALALGPGLGISSSNEKLFKNLLHFFNAPMVIDADGISILSQNKSWLSYLPQESILTPHPGEFERLVGKTQNTLEVFQKATEFCSKYNVYLVYKNFYSVVFTPHGKKYFITAGNSGMAKGGSGDVLTGVIGSLLAQGYPAEHAAVLGTWVHATAGAKAAEIKSETGMTPTDLIDHLCGVWLQLENR